MAYVEYSVSGGHGILLEHGVHQYDGELLEPIIDRPLSVSGLVLMNEAQITDNEAAQFQAMHGSMVAT